MKGGTKNIEVCRCRRSTGTGDDALGKKKNMGEKRRNVMMSKTNSAWDGVGGLWIGGYNKRDQDSYQCYHLVP
jgi:hypothetical protein